MSRSPEVFWNAAAYLLQTSGKAPPSSFEIVQQALPNLLLGAVVTVKLTLVSIVLGLIIGSLMGIMRLSSSRPLSLIAKVYIEFFRGSPLLIQIFMIYFGLPQLIQSTGLKFSFDQWTAAIIALSLNSGAYIAEVVRGSIQSIDWGQREASQSLGLGPVQTMRYVIFPQAFRRMIPPLGNDFISLLKDTSLVAVIGFAEIFRRGQEVVARTYQPFAIYFSVALIYLVLTLAASFFFSWLERQMNPVERAKKKARQSSLAVE